MSFIPPLLFPNSSWAAVSWAVQACPEYHIFGSRALVQWGIVVRLIPSVDTALHYCASFYFWISWDSCDLEKTDVFLSEIVINEIALLMFGPASCVNRKRHKMQENKMSSGPCFIAVSLESTKDWPATCLTTFSIYLPQISCYSNSINIMIL